MILFPIHLTFIVGLCKFLYDKHKSSMIFGVLSALLLPKETPHKLSKAERTASRTLVMKYTCKSQEYELILPARTRPLGWSKALATMSDDTEKDVTELVAAKAGPYRDFFGLSLKSSQIIRGSKEIRLFDSKENLVVLFK